jgi:hypothetical protein
MIYEGMGVARQDVIDEVLYLRSAGLDLGKRFLLACVRVPNPARQGTWSVETERFGTTPAEVRRLLAWLTERRVEAKLRRWSANRTRYAEQDKGDGYEAWYKVPSPTTPCPATPTRWRPSAPQATRHGYKALRRRSQRTRMNWERMNRLVDRWLPPARARHPFPDVRFYPTNPR